MSKDTKFDIVMQGPIWPQTLDTAKFYLECPLVNKVVISTWENEKIFSNNPNIIVVVSKDPSNPGRGNRNRQIISSALGVKHCVSPIVVKTRTDQKLNDLIKMSEYFTIHSAINHKFTDGTGPSGSILVMGMYKIFPFHPQDHVFWGYLDDIKKLFDLPLEDENPAGPDEFLHTHIRTNCYLGMYYYARFDARIQHIVEHPKEYLVDQAPKLSEAMALHNEYSDVFKPFPKINLWWFKHNRNYPYEWGIPYTEYWG